MTVLESKIQELDANATAAGSSSLIATALAVALLIAQYSHLPVLIEDGKTGNRGTSGTISHAISLEVSEIDLFRQINRVYDDLLKNQQDLDPDSKRALYANLWDLYT
jgi:hypothetical protein